MYLFYAVVFKLCVFNSGGTHLFGTHKTLKGDLPWNGVWFSVVCTRPLFYFSFRSFRKDRRAGEQSERARESEGERGARERKISSPTLPPCAGGK